MKTSPPTRKISHSKALLTFLLCLVLTCAQMAPALAEVSAVPDGYIRLGSMAFTYKNNGFDIRGLYGNNWIRTSYNNVYPTYLKFEGQDTSTLSPLFFITSDANSDGIKDAMSCTENGVKVAITAAKYQDTTLQVLYTLKNTSAETKTFRLGTGTDVQIASADNANISVIGNDAGLKMVSNDSRDAINNVYPQFSFFGSGYDGVTDVTEFWYGPYSSSYSEYHWNGNSKNAVFYTKANSVALDSKDSAMSWHWNVTLAAGETKVYSVLIAVGESGSDDAVPGTSLNSPTGSVILNLQNAATGTNDFTVTLNNQPLTPNTDYTVRNANTDRPIIQFTENALGITCDVNSINVLVNSTGETAAIEVALPHTSANGHDAPQRPDTFNPNPNPAPSDPVVPTVPVPPPAYPNLPKTGDSTPIALWMALLLGSALVLMHTQRKIKKSH